MVGPDQETQTLTTCVGSYSTIWLAQALPDDGEIFTFELNETHAKVCLHNSNDNFLTL